jgi:hypothetical protein
MALAGMGLAGIVYLKWHFFNPYNFGVPNSPINAEMDIRPQGVDSSCWMREDCSSIKRLPGGIEFNNGRCSSG